jgi:hypothetical protein
MQPEKDMAVALLLTFVYKITTFESPSMMYRPRLREEITIFILGHGIMTNLYTSFFPVIAKECIS